MSQFYQNSVVLQNLSLENKDTGCRNTWCKQEISVLAAHPQ